MRNLYLRQDLNPILVAIIQEAMIYESTPGHYNTV